MAAMGVTNKKQAWKRWGIVGLALVAALGAWRWTSMGTDAPAQPNPAAAASAPTATPAAERPTASNSLRAVSPVLSASAPQPMASVASDSTRQQVDARQLKAIEAQFEGDYRLEFNLAPPLVAARDLDTGHLKKRTFGPWMLRAFRALARLRHLRGTKLDIFGYSAERRLERQLIADYERVIEELIGGLEHVNHDLAVQIAEIPEHIRGYGHIKQAHLEKAKARELELLAAFRTPAPQRDAAE